MIKEYEDIYKTCVSLFGADRVSREDLHDPEGIELEVRLDDKLGHKFKRILLALYRTTPSDCFMGIDDFRFEYDNNEEYAISEMKKYLTAAANNNLATQGWSILGLKLNQKILIKE